MPDGPGMLRRRHGGCLPVAENFLGSRPMQEQLIIRRADDPTAPLARAADLSRATERAAEEAIREAGVILEIFEPETGRVCLRVRAEPGGRRVLVQRTPPASGDAWPDPPVWLPLSA
jgi:hypothetical protein